MNRISVFLCSLLMLASVALQAQSSGIDRYFEQYQEDDRFTSITVSSRMFGLFAEFDMDDPDEQDLVEAISKLKGLKMLIGEEVEDAKSLYTAAVQKPAKAMEELMSIKDGDQEFKFFITEANGTISELMMVGYEGKSFMVMSLVGQISLRDISRLSQKMDIDGFEHFQNVDQ
ncbi:MAG: DUF4252 domain-containing protein [Bacteroidota bacterium]